MQNFAIPSLSVVLGFFIGVTSGCSGWQTKDHTSLSGPTSKARLLELCYKANTGKGQTGGNVLHCKELQDAITPAGQWRQFTTCAKYMANDSQNQGVIADYKPYVNCRRLFLEPKTQK